MSHCQFAGNSQHRGPCSSTGSGVHSQQSPACRDCYRSDSLGVSTDKMLRGAGKKMGGTVDWIAAPQRLLLFSHLIVSDSLLPHGLQHARLPCPSLSPGVCSNSCPLSQRCHPTISSSVVPFSSCPQSFQHQCLFQWVGSSHQVAKVLEFQLQHQSFPWIVSVDFF